MANKSGVTIERITINLNPNVMEALANMADRQRITKSEAIRRAISTEAFRLAVEADGGYLVVEKNGVRERVHFPY